MLVTISCSLHRVVQWTRKLGDVLYKQEEKCNVAKRFTVSHMRSSYNCKIDSIHQTISFPEPTCLLVSAKTRSVLALTKGNVVSGNEIVHQTDSIVATRACAVATEKFKVAHNSFQYFPRRRFWCVIITTRYHLMLQSWYQFRDTIGYHSNTMTC